MLAPGRPGHPYRPPRREVPVGACRAGLEYAALWGCGEDSKHKEYVDCPVRVKRRAVKSTAL